MQILNKKITWMKWYEKLYINQLIGVEFKYVIEFDISIIYQTNSTYLDPLDLVFCDLNFEV